MLVSQNRVNVSSGTFIFADSLSKNISLTIMDNFDSKTIQLVSGATLKLIPMQDMISTISIMRLRIGAEILSETVEPRLELILDSSEIGTGNFMAVVEIIFLNGTGTNWSLVLNILGGSFVSESTSKAKLVILDILVLSMIIRWSAKKPKRALRFRD